MVLSEIVVDAIFSQFYDTFDITIRIRAGPTIMQKLTAPFEFRDDICFYNTAARVRN